LIITVIVDAINRQMLCIAIGPRPIPKGLELLPFHANANSTSTIARESLAMRIAASRFHASPDAVQARSGIAMLPRLLRAIISAPAAARFRVTTAQKLADDGCLAAARAMTLPQGIFVFSTDARNDGQSTERLASDIDDLGHGSPLTRLLCQVTGWRPNAGPSRILARWVCQ
jgi:hypothetical protein